MTVVINWRYIFLNEMYIANLIKQKNKIKKLF